MRWNRALACALLASVPLLIAAAPEAKTPLVHKTKYIMGTVYEIAVYDDQPLRASQAIDKAFAEIVRLDAVMSNFKPQSDLSRLNRNAHYRAEKVPADLYRVIEESVRYSKVSGGKFDITVGPLVDLWKAALRGERVPTEDRGAETAGVRGIRKNRADSAGPRGIPFTVHEDRFGIDWKRVRGGPRRGDPAGERDRERAGGCWTKHDLWNGRAAEKKRVGSALAGSIEPHRSTSDVA